MQARFDFSDASVLVVGARRAGIGAAIARAFQAAGAEVTITGVEDQPAEEDRQRFRYVKLDVTDTAAVRALGAAIDRLDVLVNCAAITARGEEMEPSFFEKVVNVDLHGIFRTAETFHPHLKASGGSLINIASMGAPRPAQPDFATRHRLDECRGQQRGQPARWACGGVW